jgi:signal transduction histidine kinase
MAHELRAPIQNLVGATEVALLSRREADSYRRVLESNLDELRELGDAIDNLMTICAPQSLGAHTPVSEDFDLVEEARLRLERDIVILVDDDGPGVPVEQREKIFDPFYRGPSAHGRRVGYGLGLAMVKDAADHHAGSVAVESSPSGGARFRLTLPRRGLSSVASRVAEKV